jgi:carbamate kinase
MLVVLELGGNALLQRGQPMTEQQQRANVKTAAQALADVAREHMIVITHGNGPQVGLLALQSAAYTEVEPYPLDALGAQTEGMIGYLIEQELGNLMPYEQPIATVLTMIEVDPNDPAFHKPAKPIGPVYTREQAERLAKEKSWTMAPDNDKFRRVVPSPLPKHIYFAAGSMGPKVEAACDFVRTTGGISAIGTLEEALHMLQGTAGTTFAANAGEIEWYEQPVS